jgi:hypothetical protein
VLTTQAVKLTVHPSDADQLLAVEVSAGRSRLYVGQRVQLTMTIWVKPARYGNQLLDAPQMLRQVSPIEFGPFPLQVSRVTRRPRPGSDPAELWYAYEFVTSFVAERPGPLTFDNLEVGLAYPGRAGIRHLRARPTVSPAEVLPVPMEGRPPDYNGAVGLFDIEVGANPTEVRVGDPIDLTIDIFGDGPLETLPPPLLSANARLTDGFRLPGEQLAGEVQDGRRRFKLTIRARRDDVTEIPAIEYPYFDPDAERFVVARSDPVPLTVTPAAEIAPPPPTSPRGPSAGPSATALQALDGLRDIETAERMLLADLRPITPRLVGSVALAPPAVFLLAWTGLTWVQRRTADPARRRRQTALRTARKRIARARGLPPRDTARELTAALTGYLADRLNEPPARFTGSAALDLMRAREVPDDLIEQWALLVQGCEEASWGTGLRPVNCQAGGLTSNGTPASGELLRTQAVTCLTALERHQL